MTLAVGSKVWLFWLSGGGHYDFSAWFVVDETSRSWIVSESPGWKNNSRKIPKSGHAEYRDTAGGYPMRFYLTREAAERAAKDCIWAARNAHQIKKLVGGIRDAALLREVAKVIGYDDTKGGAE